VNAPVRRGPQRSPRALSLALATLLVAGCVGGSLSPVPAPAPTAQRVVGAEGFSADLATADDRIAAFEYVWHTVSERFYEPSFNGVDWDAVRLRYLPQLERVRSDGGFYNLLGRMVGELRDSHTRIYTAREYRNRLESVLSTVGVRVAEIEGTIAIVEVVPDTPALTAGLKPGMIVSAVNGENARERLQRLTSEAPADASPERRQRNIYSRMLSTRTSALLKLKVETPSGPREIELSRTEREMPASVSHRILAGNVGFIAFNRFRSETAADFSRALAHLAATDSLIIDLRGNPGGSIGAMLTIAQNFLPDARHVLTRRLRVAGPVPAAEGPAPVRQSTDVRINGNLHAYTRPLALLVDGQTASSSELLATVLREQRDAHIVGRPSCGCVVAVRTSGYRLAGGGALYVAETGFVTPRGNRMEGAGIQPDSPVPLTLADLRDGVDRDLLVAQEALRSASQRFAEEH
jgi:carboxyl-terminal processing protease